MGCLRHMYQSDYNNSQLQKEKSQNLESLQERDDEIPRSMATILPFDICRIHVHMDNAAYENIQEFVESQND